MFPSDVVVHQSCESGKYGVHLEERQKVCWAQIWCLFAVNCLYMDAQPDLQLYCCCLLCYSACNKHYICVVALF